MSPLPSNAPKAAAQAEQAADDAVRGAGLAIDAAREAEKDASATQAGAPLSSGGRLPPARHPTGRRVLTSGSKRNRWRACKAFDEQLAALEQRRERFEP